MELYQIVQKLVGPITPVGSTEEDARRLKNLVAIEDLIDTLLQDVVRVALMAGQHQASINEAGKQAEQFLREVIPERIDF